MKKVLLVTFLSLAISTVSLAQEGFSAKAGLNSVSYKIDTGEVLFGSFSTSELGFFVGGAYNFEIDDQFDIEPSALLSFVSGLNSLYVPVMLKYEVAPSFNVQAGPQINYLLESNLDGGAFGLDLAFGGGYQFDDNWFVEARYGFQISRGGDFGSVSKLNTLTLSGGYRFN